MSVRQAFDLSGQVAVVTGAGQGIGAAVARAMASAGAAVAVCDINEAAAIAAATSITAAGGRARGFALDVADSAQVAGLAGEVMSWADGLSIWVNNAGITRPAMLHKMSDEDFDAVLSVHVRGTFFGIREAARIMKVSKVAGTIINVTSSAGLDGTVGQINYSAAKGAVIAMTKSAARELASSSIRVNAVSPAAATPMTETIRNDERFAARYLAKIPLGRWAQPDEIAPAFVFLASAASSYVTGQVLCADGGTYMAN